MKCMVYDIKKRQLTLKTCEVLQISNNYIKLRKRDCIWIRL